MIGLERDSAGDVGAPSVGLADNSGEHLEDDRAREESVGLDDAWMKLGNDGDNVGGPSQDSMEMEVEDNQKCLSVSGHDKLDHSEGLIHKIDPSEVTKVKDALKKSCFDLNMAVEDPLPEAHVVAAAVLASMSRASTPVDYSRNSLEDVRCNVSWNLSDFKHLEENHVGKECNMDHGESKSIGIVPCGSLFNRKATARTYEWDDDSDDSCFEKSQVHVDNHQSPNPRTRRVFLPKLSKGKFVRKRAVKRWTPKEEDTLREAVAKYGKGQWKLILNIYKIFEERTEIDLKDKWRNMSRH
ncbi:Telomere repeat-binding factor 3 [Platanthera zijinensis]|uniref:Telomere repeat-binding factor 3 n=1 Tax=Platanthera zijinensis TaxID=2320716 RepID=A0AAP0AZQ1_9ASPA